MSRFWGRGWDGGNGGFDDGRWEGVSRDVLEDNVLSKIMSKVLMDKGILSGRGKEIFFFVFTVGGFVGGDVSKDVEAKDRGGRDRSTGNDISGTVWDVVKGGPDGSGRWRVSKLGGLWDDWLKDAGGDV